MIRNWGLQLSTGSGDTALVLGGIVGDEERVRETFAFLPAGPDPATASVVLLDPDGSVTGTKAVTTDVVEELLAASWDDLIARARPCSEISDVLARLTDTLDSYWAGTLPEDLAVGAVEGAVAELHRAADLAR